MLVEHRLGVLASDWMRAAHHARSGSTDLMHIGIGARFCMASGQARP
jgi:hypothetical protein